MVSYISSGRDYKIFNLSLTTSFQDVDIDVRPRSFFIQTQNGSKVNWRRSASATTEFTIKPGMSYSIDGSIGVASGTTHTIGQAKLAAAGADTLEVWVWHE